MIVQLRWADADIASAYWAYLKRNPGRLARYFRYPIVAIVVSGVVLVQYPGSWQLVGWLVLFDVGTIAYQLLISQRNANRRFKNSRLLKDSVSVTIDGRSIRFSGPELEREKQWSEFSDIFESKRLFMFIAVSNKILFIPKSGLSDPQIAELRVLIATYAMGTVRVVNSAA
jgi:hypothetical protein